MSSHLCDEVGGCFAERKVDIFLDLTRREELDICPLSPSSTTVLPSFKPRFKLTKSDGEDYVTQSPKKKEPKRLQLSRTISQSKSNQIFGLQGITNQTIPSTQSCIHSGRFTIMHCSKCKSDPNVLEAGSSDNSGSVVKASIKTQKSYTEEIFELF